MTGVDGNSSGNLTDDAFLGGRLRIFQLKNGYRAALDAVMLAASAEVEPGLRVLDAGSGVGTVGLCLLARCPGARVTALDIDAAAITLASQNADRNGLADRLQAVQGDIWTSALAGNADGPFDLVLSNPPYYEAARVTAPPDPAKRNAFILPPDKSLGDWVRACLKPLRPGGRFVFVLPAASLDVLLADLTGTVGGLRLFPLWPGPGKPAKRVLLAGLKGTAGSFELLPGLCLHAPGQRYTPEAEAVLRHGEGLGLI